MFGLLNQPRYRNFWSKDPFLGNQGVQRVFSLKHYSKLSEYLHVSDRKAEHNRGSPLYDKLGKVRWLYDHLLQTFPKFKNPERVQVIDEQIMPFSRRISYIQYNVNWPSLWPWCDLDIQSNLWLPLEQQHMTTNLVVHFHLHHDLDETLTFMWLWCDLDIQSNLWLPLEQPHMTTNLVVHFDFHLDLHRDLDLHCDLDVTLTFMWLWCDLHIQSNLWLPLEQPHMTTNLVLHFHFYLDFHCDLDLHHDLDLYHHDLDI